jgi:hypothetical protein
MFSGIISHTNKTFTDIWTASGRRFSVSNETDESELHDEKDDEQII